MKRLKDIKRAIDDDATYWAPAGDGEIEVQVRPFSNPESRRAMQRLQRKYGQVLEHMNEKKRDALNAKVVADTILVGWRGVAGDNGKALRYTPERGLDALVEHEWFLDDVVTASQQYAAFRKEQVDEAAEVMKKKSGSKKA